MEAVLDKLEKEAWVRGSMIVSDEGMVVVERLSGDLNRDAVAAEFLRLFGEVAGIPAPNKGRSIRGIASDGSPFIRRPSPTFRRIRHDGPSEEKDELDENQC